MTQQLMLYKKQIEAMHQSLGIPNDYAISCGLELQPECQQLVETELDVFARQAMLDSDAFKAWTNMQSSASLADIELQIVSAYRSADYQQQLLQNKLAKGQVLEDILKVNAAPGYSEHHTGCAVDIGCTGFEHLSEDFEKSPAFAWLCTNGHKFGFSLSFPRDNAYGILYEPWHWRHWRH